MNQSAPSEEKSEKGKEIYRRICHSCRKAQVMCYCDSIKPFESSPQFIILIHPKEAHKAINTGRMAYRLLSNSYLFEGIDFTHHSQLNQIIRDETKRCFLLFPGAEAIDLKDLREIDGDTSGKKTVFIILDATWHMARTMFRQSLNLQKIPQVMFHPSVPSGFSIRRQPHADFYSTIETIHHIINVMGAHPEGEQQQLMEIFQKMVKIHADWKIQKQVTNSFGAVNDLTGTL